MVTADESWTVLGTTTEGVVIAAAPADPGWWHVLWCLECTRGRPGEEVPFPTMEARQEWMTAHTEGTDHSQWRTLSIRKGTRWRA